MDEVVAMEFLVPAHRGQPFVAQVFLQQEAIAREKVR